MRIIEFNEILLLTQVDVHDMTAKGTLVCQIDVGVEDRETGKALIPVVVFTLQEDEGQPGDEEFIEFMHDASSLITPHIDVQLSSVLSSILSPEDVIKSAYSTVLADRLGLSIRVSADGNDIVFCLYGDGYSCEASALREDFARFFDIDD